MPNQHDEERRNWDANRVKEDLKMWREITGGGRTLTQDQQDRYEATRRAAQRHGIILVEK